MTRYGKVCGGVIVLALLCTGCGQAASNGTNQPSPTTTNATNNVANSGAGTTSTPPSTTTTTQPRTTLEKIEVTSQGLVITTTRGNMQTAFTDPVITTGHPSRFTVTLTGMAPGNVPMGTSKVTSKWATSMTLTKQANDIHMSFDLASGVTSFTTAIGMGDMISFTFH